MYQNPLNMSNIGILILVWVLKQIRKRKQLVSVGDWGGYQKRPFLRLAKSLCSKNKLPRRVLGNPPPTRWEPFGRWFVAGLPFSRSSGYSRSVSKPPESRRERSGSGMYARVSRFEEFANQADEAVRVAREWFIPATPQTGGFEGV